MGGSPHFELNFKKKFIPKYTVEFFLKGEIYEVLEEKFSNESFAKSTEKI